MKKVTLFILFSLIVCIGTSLPVKKKYKGDKIVRIIKRGKCEGRPTYHVYFASGKLMQYMYREEIEQCKKTGIWKYDESLTFKK